MKLSASFFLLTGVTASCPYSDLWIKHGAKKATEILEARTGRNDIRITPGHGKTFKALAANDPPIGYGTCEYDNPFSGTSDCIQLSGEGWNRKKAVAMCDNAMMGMAKGTLTAKARCPQSDSSMLAGYCYSKEGTGMTEASPMMVDPSSPFMATCADVYSGCTTWSAGRFEYAGICNSDGTMKSVEVSDGPSDAPAAKANTQPACTIAPGPMGAAHQNAFSEGYRVDCEDAPGKNSPYQWPLRYQASFNSTSMPVPSTGRESYTSYGTVYYDFSRNWKRQDTFMTGGSLPFVSEEMVGSKHSTVLHRGSEMVFLNYWPNGTTTCNSMDLGVIGNVRPDWFMDNRGAATSTQYMGNQHIYHRGEPTLVKQWRKKDFADMYFVMSMAADADENGVHWPLQRNDPGEGFGDDNLHSFFDHKLLTEDDEDLFLIDKDFDCEARESSGDSEGPPVAGLTEEEPSNLNVDETGWFEFEYTYSPQGPATPEEAQKELEASENVGSGGSPSTSTMAMWSAELLDAGWMDACLNEDENIIEATVTFESDDEVWTAFGVRKTNTPDICSMTPADIVLAEYNEDGSWELQEGALKASLHRFSVTDAELQAQYDQMQPVNDDSKTVSRDGTYTVLTINHPIEGLVEDGEDRIPLTWAIGKTPSLNYHVTRGCLDLYVSELPVCGSMIAGSSSVDATAIASEAAAQCVDASKESMDAVNEQLRVIQETLNRLTTEEHVSVNSHNSESTDVSECSTLRQKGCRESSDCEWHAQSQACKNAEILRRTG